MKILVVDDEQDICEILQYNLENEGFEVVTAYSAEEALELPLQDYSLILLDVMMGEMSGFQMARRLKNDPATTQIPIIFITALDNEDNLVKLYSDVLNCSKRFLLLLIIRLLTKELWLI